MQNLRVTLTLLALLGILGCRTGSQKTFGFRQPAAQKTVAQKTVAQKSVALKDEVTFTFVIHSDPAGAEVIAPWPTGGEQRLGTTPLTLTATLTRGRQRGIENLFKKRDWKFIPQQGSPFVFKSGRDFITLKIPELKLQKDGYEQEIFTGSWVFPANLKQQVSRWKSVPIDTRYQKRVVFKTPTSESASTTVTIDCATGAAMIRALDADGKAGSPVGTTPLACRIGFAPERTEAGEIVKWRSWASKHPELWKVAPNGDLTLNAILEREGYSPEKVSRRVCNFKDPPPAEQTVQLQMVRPAKPEAQFKLSLDSLPSDATVYVLNADGSLGEAFGKTPLEIVIGVAQESEEKTPGMYVHKDWRLWAPVGLVRWDVLENGALAVKLTCAVYKDGFAVENVIHPIFELRPGKPYPVGSTITIPLPSAEQAAVRESHRLQQARLSAANDLEQSRRPVRVWQQPPLVAPAAVPETRKDEAATGKKPPRSWWGRLWHRNSSMDSEDDE